MSPMRTTLLIASFLILFAGQCAAVELGTIELQSQLGAPLRAQIQLSELGDLSADQLKVAIGSAADYAAMGIDYDWTHTRIKIKTEVKNGRGIVTITTREPVNEPYLNFVLNLYSPKSQVARAYTLLLDVPAVPKASAASH